MQRRRGRVRRLVGWFGRRRFARYAALRQVWHKHYGYGGYMSLNSRPSNAYVMAAEYAWQMGLPALNRQIGSTRSQLRNGMWRTRGGVDYQRVARAVEKRRKAENATDHGLGLA